MKILLSNDDGIYAPGIRVLYDLLLEMGHEVCLVAPCYPKSGTSHSITLETPLTSEKIYIEGEFYGVAVDGFPVDCVRLGLMELYPDVDIVVTGINLGLNAGPCVYYSGTVAAACEGFFSSKPAIAFSLYSFEEKVMKQLSYSFKPFLQDLLNHCTDPLLYNVNIPPDPKIKGIKLARQSHAFFNDLYEKRQNPRGKDYYWLKGLGFKKEIEPVNNGFPADLDVLEEGYVSLTPLQLDLTHYQELNKLSEKIERTKKVVNT